MPSLLDLNSEILLAILLELDVQDIFVCKRVNKQFRALAESSAVQYKHQLSFAAAVNGVTSRNPGSKDRLQALKEYQFAWRTFQLPVNPTFSSTETPTSGVHPFRLLKFSGPLIAMYIGSELKLSRPESSKRRVQAMSWSTHIAALGQKPLVGASDLRENVVAICGAKIGKESSFRCNLVTLLPDGSMSHHPHATQAVLEIPGLDSPENIVQADMLGDILVISACGQSSSLYVLDWKTGEVLLSMTRAGPSLICAHLLDKNLLLIGYRAEVSIHAIDSTRGPDRSVIPLCALLPPPHGFRIESIPSQPVSSATDDDGLFHSDPQAALFVLHFRCPFRYREDMDYVLCIPRPALLANIGMSPTITTSLPTVRARHLPWEDWSRGGDVLACIGIQTTTHADIAVAACGSRVSVIFNMLRTIGPPAVSITAVYVFEMHRWAQARDGIVTRAPGTVQHFFNFKVLPPFGLVRPQDPLPYRISKQDVVYEDNQWQRPSHRKFVVLLEDTVALVREDILEGEDFDRMFGGTCAAALPDVDVLLGAIAEKDTG
ncbi:hypothetical protein VTO73DRAFT_11701 [Trametes versicolor]